MAGECGALAEGSRALLGPSGGFFRFCAPGGCSAFVLRPADQSLPFCRFSIIMSRIATSKTATLAVLCMILCDSGCTTITIAW